MPRLLIVEDEPVLREEVAEFLGAHGYQIAAVGDLKGFNTIWAPKAYTIVVVDLGLPDGDGMSLIEQVRKEDDATGIVVLTAQGQSARQIKGLESGADHYLVKPFRLDSLLATINSLARRLGSEAAETWALDEPLRQLIAPGDIRVPLSAQDYLVLNALFAGHGRPVSRRQIVESMGEDFLSYDQRRLDTQMRRLRIKVRELAGRDLPVNTVHSVGYVFPGATKIFR